MEKHLITAFNKLEKRENLIRIARNQRALGRITNEVYQARVAEIEALCKLTVQERRAHEMYIIMTQGRKRRK